ncbi:MAG: ABC transporter permease [Bermanella sp.]
MAALRTTSFYFALLALLALFFADLEITSADPWWEIQRLLTGFAHPSFLEVSSLSAALFKTLAFAFQGVMVAAVLGFLLALAFKYFWVRTFAAFIRAIHELFWALLFIQLTGLSSLTGLLAIVIPFSGIFAKVFAEILQETDKKAELSLPPHTAYLSKLLYTKFMQAWPQLMAYTSYRLECGIRSSAVLGFVGLPTLGFELESFFKQGDYAQAAALLYVFFMVIASLKYLLKPLLIPFYTLAAFIYLPPVADVSWSLVATFFSEDIIPVSLQNHDLPAFFDWLAHMWHTQIRAGIFNTLVLTQIALVSSAVLTLLLFPFACRLFFNKLPRTLGQSGLIIMRSCPEYLLAFVTLLVFGPSMWPAILALTLHNGAVIAHLLALQTASLHFRADRSRGLNLYFYEVLPRLYGNFLALLFYRWEVILRETAILGMLGIPTLGFFIDSAFEEIRFDRAMLLILITALLNILVDNVALYFRRRLHLTCQPQSL